jgi:hypothetical protein
MVAEEAEELQKIRTIHKKSVDAANSNLKNMELLILSKHLKDLEEEFHQ